MHQSAACSGKEGATPETVEQEWHSGDSIDFASHQCDPGSNPRVDTICVFSLLLVLIPAPKGFLPGSLVFLPP